MNKKMSRIRAFLPRAIFIAFLALPIVAAVAGSNNPRHQRHTGSSDAGKVYTIFKTAQRAM